MSSRQIKWMREQLAKQKQESTPTNASEEDEIPISAEPSTDLSILMEDSSNPTSSPSPTFSNIPLPPPSASKSKKAKPTTTTEEEIAELEALVNQRQLESANTQPTSETVATSFITGFNMQQLNFIQELKSHIGPTQFDECLKVPKSASSTRFMARRKRWKNPLPQFFILTPTPTENDPNALTVTLTEQASSELSVFKALERINDEQGLIQLQSQSPFCPLLFPMACQMQLFQGEFEAATEIAVRGLWILQQSLPASFKPLQSHILPSPPRQYFLELIAFIARFAFRRGLFKSSLALWKFGMSLTPDDPKDFNLLAAVPALYARDKEFINSVLESNIYWRAIPIKYIPDWKIAQAALELPDDILPLANEMAKWPWAFREDGVSVGEGEEIPPLLSSVLGAMRRRMDKFFKENNEMKEVFENTAMIANDIEIDDERSICVSYWVGVPDDQINIADMVEEMVMPIGGENFTI